MKTLKICILPIILIVLLASCSPKKDDTTPPISNPTDTTSKNDAKKPVITTNDITNISFLTATCGGVILTDNGAAITQQGICWSVNANPTINDSKLIIAANGSSNFSGELTGLSINTKYYVRAFAINSNGIAYGTNMIKSFTTLNVTAAPVVVTNAASVLAYNGATLNGSVSGDLVTERGFEVYNGSTLMGKVVVNSSSNDFSTIISNCAMNTNYSYRAYAINVVGTSYGSSVSFKTSQPNKPTVNISQIGNDIRNNGYFSCSCTISIISDGGAPITEMGFIYKINEIPVLNDDGTTNGIKSINNSTQISINNVKMNSGDIIYVIAYAKNMIGYNSSSYVGRRM